MPDLLDNEPPERADAAANRKRILAASERLFAERGPDITMSDLAAAAGVGRGTLYRRYSDVRAVATALLDVHERELQQALLTGPPPLGPDAAPRERLCAFYAAMADLLEQHLPLVLGAERGGARFRTGAYGFWRTFVTSLLRDTGGDEALGDPLLAPLAPEVYQFQRYDRGLSPLAVKDALARLAVVLPDPDDPS